VAAVLRSQQGQGSRPAVTVVSRRPGRARGSARRRGRARRGRSPRSGERPLVLPV